MIPITLKIENFMSYRDAVPELDFTGMTVAALCGRNGHGKSALLDAITWGLWGRCRVRSADDLVSLGTEETRVELTFSASNETYRVIRSHIKSGGRRKTGVTDLQLQIKQQDNFIPITEDSVRNTQTKIIDVVRMDYDTFINSAFLLQGHSDEFTNKTPSQRKEILANILGLGIYDKYQEEARFQLSELTSQLQNITGAMQYIESDMESMSIDEDGLIKELTTKSQELETSKAQKIKIEVEWSAKSEEVTKSEIEITQLKQMAQTISGVENDINFLTKDKEQKQYSYNKFQDLFSQEQMITQNNILFENSKTDLEIQQKEQAAFIGLQSSLSDIELTISRHQTAMETQLAQKQSDIARYVNIAQQLTELLAGKQNLESELGSLSASEEKIQSLKSDEIRLTAQISEAQTLSELHEKEGKEIKQKLDLIEQSSVGMHHCPLCQTQLDESSGQNLKASYQDEITAKRDQYLENKHLIEKLTTDVATVADQVKNKTEILEKTRNDLNSRITIIKGNIEASKEAESAVIKLQKECADLSLALDNQDFLQEEQKVRKELTTQMSDSVYDPEIVENLRQYLSTNQSHADLNTQLLSARAQAPETENQIKELHQRIILKQEEFTQLSKSLTTVDSKLNESELLKQNLSKIQQSLNLINEQIKAHEIDIQGIQTQVNRARDSKKRLNEFKTQRTDTENNHKIYTEVANAFGRQGIQAMLIEALIPQIEEETNLLLSKMTDNRLYTTLETTRERRTGKGDPIETLDISIADELGKRSYESYSGGEAFRINLALRIALSKVLARRSGASLPVLFLDEGFGTQDSIGREKILDTISSISDQFEKIIVITHLDDLKDAFPTRIEVTKDQAGSTFTIDSA